METLVSGIATAQRNVVLKRSKRLRSGIDTLEKATLRKMT